MNTNLLLGILLCIHATISFAQHPIQGKVSDNNGTPLENAIIRHDKTIVAYTDKDGLFKFNAPAADSLLLTVSHLGYITVDKTLHFPYEQYHVVQLTPLANELQEVNVYTGYQILPKERATGSFESVDNKLLNRQIGTDVISRLNGLVPGVLFNHRQGDQSQWFNIRGISTLTASRDVSAPLIVLDNFPYEGNIDNINPNDVENITFLKDAAATSIWGARAGNGVVVITTKKGGYNTPMTVSLNANVTLREKPDLFYRPQMSPAEFIDMESFLFEQGAFDANLGNSRTWPVITPVVDILEKERSGEWSAQQARTAIDALRANDIRRDYSNYLYRNAINQQYALSLKGGAGKANYLISAGFDKNLENLRRNSFDRISLRSQLGIKPTDRIELQAGLAYTINSSADNNSGEIRLGANRGIYPYARLVDENGLPAIIEQDYRKGYVDTAGGGRLLDWYYRPLEEVRLADNTTGMRDLLFNLGANLRLARSVNAEVKYMYEYQTTNQQHIRSEESYFTRNLINRFTQLDGDNIEYAVPFGAVLDHSMSNLSAQSLRTQFNANIDWWGPHKLNGLVGGEIRSTMIRGATGRQYGYDSDLMTAQAVDYINRYPVYDGLASNALIPNMDAFSGRDIRFVSLYANAAYAYNDKYIVSGSARRDASNLFGVETNNRWKPLWSLGAKWQIEREPFFQSDVLSKLALGITYGYSGNVNNSIPAVTTMIYSNSLSQLARLPYGTIQNPPNPLLQWENVNQLNVRTEIASKTRRITANIEYYRKKSENLIAAVNADLTTGFMTLSTNSASLLTNGMDISIATQNTVGKLSWNTNAFISYNTNKVSEYLYDGYSIASYLASDNTIVPAVGYPVNSVFSYRWAGLDPANGDPRGYLDGQPSTDYLRLTQPEGLEDLVFHGSAIPKVFGGLRNDFSYKNFSLSVNITYRLGYFFRAESIQYSTLLRPNTEWGHGDFAKRWMAPGDERYTQVPSMRYPVDARRDNFYAYSEILVNKGDHIRLQDINLTYHMPGTPVGNLKFTLYARNLGLIWKASDIGLDPDFPSMAPQRTMALGVSSNF